MAEKIRVAHIASGDLWAGAENVVYQLVCGLSKMPEIELKLILLNHGRLEDLCIRAGIDTVVVDERNNGFMKIIRTLVPVVRSFSPDVIHSHRYKENLLAALLKLFCGFPCLVTTIHGLPEFSGSIFEEVKNRADRFILRFFFKKIVGVSNEVSEHLKSYFGMSSNKVVTIHNGIEIDRPLTRQVNSGRINVGSAGRFSPVKDFPLLVDIAHKTCSRHDGLEFIIVGDGPDKLHIKAKIKDYGLEEKVHLPGNVTDMPSFYRQLDLYVNTSRHEGIPMTVLEAMMYGIPVITFDVGGLKEIITDGIDGILVKERNSDAFSSKLLNIIANSRRMRDLGNTARKKIESDFSNEAMTSSYCGLYKSHILK